MDSTLIIVAVGIVVISYLWKAVVRHTTLRLFPELSLLRTPGARARALQLAKPLFRVPSTGTFMFFGALILSFPFAVLLHMTLRFSTPFALSQVLLFAVILLLLSVSNLVLARNRISSSLRRQLVDRTIPVCLTCGYDLRGQTEARCPECGSACDRALVEDRGPLDAPPIQEQTAPGGSRGDHGAIEVRFEYTDELLRAAMNRYWWTLSGKTAFGISLAYTLFFVPAVVLLGDTWVVGALGALLVLSIVGALRSRRILINAAVNKWRKQPSRTVRMAFSEQGIEADAADGHTTLEWSTIEKLWRFTDVWLVFQSEYEPIILPTAALDDHVRELITRKLLREGIEVA